MTTGLFRLRVRYGKHNRLRHLGHLELLRTIDRSVRRSGLPFALTQGYSPHMRIQFSSALPVGAVSLCEWYDLFLTELVGAQEALCALKEASPVDIAPLECAYVDSSLPALEAWINHFSWRLHLDTTMDFTELDCALKQVIAKGSIEYMRANKPRLVSLEDKLVSWELGHKSNGGLYFDVHTRTGEGGSLRPAVLLDAACEESVLSDVRCGYIVEKLGQWHEDEDGTLLEPLG